MARNITRIFFSTMALACAAGSTRAADLAYDSAGDSAYNSGWTNGSNGGYGWGGGWQIQASNGGKAFLGDSTTNGSGDPDHDGDINSPKAAGGRAWGLAYGSAIRPFNGPLSPGQTFAIDLDDHGTGQFSFEIYLALLAPDGSDVMTIEADQFGYPQTYVFVYGIPWTVIDSRIPWTDQGIHLAFTRLSSGYEVSLTPDLPGAATTILNVPYNGQVAAVEFTSWGSLDPRGVLNSYINNVAITPEPTGAVLIGLGVILFQRRRQTPRRRTRCGNKMI